LSWLAGLLPGWAGRLSGLASLAGWLGVLGGWLASWPRREIFTFLTFWTPASTFK